MADDLAARIDCENGLGNMTGRACAERYRGANGLRTDISVRTLENMRNSKCLGCPHGEQRAKLLVPAAALVRAQPALMGAPRLRSPDPPYRKPGEPRECKNKACKKMFVPKWATQEYCEPECAPSNNRTKVKAARAPKASSVQEKAPIVQREAPSVSLIAQVVPQNAPIVSPQFFWPDASPVDERRVELSSPLNDVAKAEVPAEPSPRQLQTPPRGSSITLSLPGEMLAMLDAAVAASGKSRTVVARELLAAALKPRGPWESLPPASGTAVTVIFPVDRLAELDRIVGATGKSRGEVARDVLAAALRPEPAEPSSGAGARHVAGGRTAPRPGPFKVLGAVALLEGGDSWVFDWDEARGELEVRQYVLDVTGLQPLSVHFFELEVPTRLTAKLLEEEPPC